MGVAIDMMSAMFAVENSTQEIKRSFYLKRTEMKLKSELLNLKKLKLVKVEVRCEIK